MWAQRRYNQYQERMPEKEAKKQLVNDLGHGRISVLRSYLT